MTSRFQRKRWLTTLNHAIHQGIIKSSKWIDARRTLEFILRWIKHNANEYETICESNNMPNWIYEREKARDLITANSSKFFWKAGKRMDSVYFTSNILMGMTARLVCGLGACLCVVSVQRVAAYIYDTKLPFIARAMVVPSQVAPRYPVFPLQT